MTLRSNMNDDKTVLELTWLVERERLKGHTVGFKEGRQAGITEAVELIRCLSYTKCVGCKALFMSRPDATDCRLADHIEAYDAIIAARDGITDNL